MADSDKAPGQAVQEEPSDELHRAEGDRLGTFFLAVLGAEGDRGVFECFDAAVCDRNPVRIAGQIFEDMFRAFDRIAHADHPVFGKKCVFQWLKLIAFKFKFLTVAGLVHELHELTAEDQR